ncbi:c-type cytochrome biogenesis protein CcmI [Spongiibacter taiwanensis]|uniref:c-type cytochrome biogenesis protein CcmI n=1 Tax=Spongiibacter taiwanensis TaxID=1748242 RepID=UPI00203573BA|nr:c-type cytochrome biogenesis protein CcmI [Spongiibacter taiwanensis]USA43174.1 c-type cytochrome biogenesis protein CcmI [Spongiibacter taiwanensis]
MSLYLGLAVLIFLALLIVLLAFSRSRLASEGSRHLHAQQGFFRQRRKELAADLASGLIDQTQFDDLERELKRQLVSETEQEPDFKPGASGRGQFFALLVLIPAVAIGLYHLLGYREDLQLKAMQREIVAAQQLTPAMLTEFEAQVLRGLEKRGDSPDHLAMMASLRRQAGDFAGAAPYYQRLLALFPNDADLMAQLAQARYLANNRQLDDEMRALLRQSLSIDPAQTTALGVLGIDAFAAGDYTQAINYWQRLLPGLAPGSSEQAVIQQGLATAKERAISAGTLTGLTVDITLAAELAPPPNGVLFVVAKSADGNPMPVAALRQRVGEGSFPSRVVLTDADVIRQGKTLADFAELLISAHISRNGTAIRQPGDLAAPSANVTAGERDAIALQIDHRVGEP